MQQKSKIIEESIQSDKTSKEFVIAANIFINCLLGIKYMMDAYLK